MAQWMLKVNGKEFRVEAPEDMPLLWALRDKIGLTGTKYGCGIGMCGICTVHIDGKAARSCVTPIGEVGGREVRTIEGPPENLRLLQDAWIAEQVSQCGFCQPGQLMAAAALLAVNPKPSDADIDQAMSGVLCRCGTYQRIRKAIHHAAAMKPDGGNA